MNKKDLIPKYFKFSHYFRYCNYPKFFILNEVPHNDYSLIFENNNEDEDSDFSELKFDLEKYEQTLDVIVKEHIVESKAKEYSNLNTFEEKINFVINLNSNKNLSFKNNLSEQELAKYKTIFENFNNILLKNEGIQLYTNQATEFIKNELGLKYKLKPTEIKIISMKLTTEKKVSETISAINDGYKLIINPIFMYKNVISAPFFYMPNLKILGNLGYSAGTSNQKLLKAWFDFSVLSKLNYEIYDYELCLMKKRAISENKDYRKWTEDEKNAIYCEEMKKWKKWEVNFCLEKYSSKAKNNNNIQGLDDSKSVKIINFLTTDHAIKKITIDEFTNYVKEIENHNEAWTLPDDISENPRYYLDYDFKDENNIHNQIIEKYKPEIFYASKEYQNANFYIINNDAENNSTSDFNEQIVLDFFANKSLILVNDNFYNKASDKEKKYFNKFMDLNKQYFVWFDFEGVTNTIPIIDYHIPWTQLVSQTSIVKTIWDKSLNNYKQFFSANYIYDPLNYNINTFIRIVDDIYDEKANAYVVFNASYESSRLKEIKRYLLCYYEDKLIDLRKMNETFNKIDHIIANLLDLERFVKISSLKNYDKPLFTISYLMCRSSIKLLEKYISAHKEYDNLLNKIEPYANLAIKNGSMALDKAILRVQGKIGNEEWEKITEALKIYCHNDVVAMIMVAEVFWRIWNNRKYYNDQVFEYMGFVNKNKLEKN